MVAPIPFNDKWRDRLTKLVLAVAEGHPGGRFPQPTPKKRQPDDPATFFQAAAVRLPSSSVSGYRFFRATATTGISYYLLTGNYGNAGRRFPASDS